jgi:hypothetical protein
MFETIEVRWFWPGSVPRAVEEWFQQGEREPDEQLPRVDHYLRTRDAESLGIKLREGRIEIKQRLQRHGIVRFRGQAAGVMEQWGKWGFALAEAGESLVDRIHPFPTWVAVEKERKLRRYRLSGGREMAAISAQEWPQRGCDFELVRVRAGSQAWWSLCLEAFGIPLFLLENLMLVAGHVLAGDIPLTLEARDSCGYPEWLGIVSGERESAS